MCMLKVDAYAYKHAFTNVCIYTSYWNILHTGLKHAFNTHAHTHMHAYTMYEHTPCTDLTSTRCAPAWTHTHTHVCTPRRCYGCVTATTPTSTLTPMERTASSGVSTSSSSTRSWSVWSSSPAEPQGVFHLHFTHSLCLVMSTTWDVSLEPLGEKFSITDFEGLTLSVLITYCL